MTLLMVRIRSFIVGLLTVLAIDIEAGAIRLVEIVLIFVDLTPAALEFDSPVLASYVFGHGSFERISNVGYSYGTQTYKQRQSNLQIGAYRDVIARNSVCVHLSILIRLVRVQHTQRHLVHPCFDRDDASQPSMRVWFGGVVPNIVLVFVGRTNFESQSIKPGLIYDHLTAAN